MALSDRIKEARIKSGLTQEQLASMIGAAKSTVTGYEKGNRIPPAATVGLIADATNVDANFLYQDEVKEHKENNISLEELSMIKKYRFISIHSPDGASVVDTVLNREYVIAKQLTEKDGKIKELEKELIPKRIFAYYGKIAAAGTSVEFSGMAAGTKSYPENDINENADYVIGVSGASMEPEYYDGDVVYVQKSEHLAIGDIGIFQKANNIYIKKVGEVGLISLNPDYPDLIADGDIITVLGRVLGKAED